MMFNIPGLPVTTNAGFKYGRGRMYETKAYTAFKELAWLTVPKDHKLYSSYVYVGVTLFISRDRDIDGSIKCLLDGLEGKCYKNDNQIVELNVKKVHCKKGAERTLVHVTPTQGYTETY